MPKKKSPLADLDFSDITNSKPESEKAKNLKKVITEEVPNWTKKRPRKKKLPLGDVVLSIPIDGESSKFITKTIMECSAKEFVRWAAGVAYPLKRETEFYDVDRNRINEFKKIVSFHRASFIAANPDALKTLH